MKQPTIKPGQQFRVINDAELANPVSHIVELLTPWLINEHVPQPSYRAFCKLHGIIRACVYNPNPEDISENPYRIGGGAEENFEEEEMRAVAIQFPNLTIIW